VHLPGKKCFAAMLTAYSIMPAGSMDSLWAWGEILWRFVVRRTVLPYEGAVSFEKVDFLCVGRRDRKMLSPAGVIFTIWTGGFSRPISG
jgi:hypothetical protein